MDWRNNKCDRPPAFHPEYDRPEVDPTCETNGKTMVCWLSLADETDYPGPLFSYRSLRVTGEANMKSSNARLGVQLFLIYLLLYGGFVLINAFAPEMMEITPIAGINLAILYGFTLIIGAFVLSLIYGVLCSAEDADVDSIGQLTGGNSADTSAASAEDAK